MPRAAPSMITLDGHNLDLDHVARVARGRERVRLSPAAAKRIDASHAALERLVAKGSVAYGINTGVGELSTVRIPRSDVRRLQVNLLRSHAIGLGAPLRTDEVRASLLLRANTFALGVSGVRRVLVTRLLDFLNRGVHPIVPSRGSLGASGDLAPLAHIGLVLIGEGRAERAGRVLSGRSALARAGLKPLTLDTKEGIAIVNGTSVMAGAGSLAVHDAVRLVRDAQVAASMSFEALRGSPRPYDDRLIGLKAQPGARAVAANMRRLLRGSKIIPSHRGPHKVQDPYTLRCIPQVLGACRAAVDGAAASLRIEMNAATDNPLVLGGQALSGGNFHGQALAMALDHASLAMAVLAGFSERRIARLVDARLSELPPFLTRRSGLNSGMMILQYVAAGYASDNKVLAHPASADSIPTSANQEDWVPMGMAAALKLRDAMENARHVVALEYLAAAQGLDFLAPLQPGRGPRAAHAAVRALASHLSDDRSLADDAARVLESMREGTIVAAAEGAAGRLA